MQYIRVDMQKLHVMLVKDRLATKKRPWMSQMDITQNQLLSTICQRLVAGFSPQRIILFGSQARGTADERSDVDILVICPINGNRRKLMVAMDKTLKGLRLARDIMILSPEEYERDRMIPGTIARPASLEGKVLYEES
jgi:uncharacterized protein